MKSKKSPTADLTKKSILFFQIGLIVALFVSWQAIEIKTYENDVVSFQKANYYSLAETEVPMIVMPKEKPPKIVQAKTKKPVQKKSTTWKVVKNPTKITSIVTIDQPIIPIPVDSIADVETEDPIKEILYGKVENVPIYPGCEKFTTNEARKQCMSAKIQEFVNDNFDTDLAQELGLSGTNRIQVLFKIDSKGNVVGVKARAPHPRLQQEAVEVVKSLPHMQPGKQQGIPVEVLYSLPIIFQVQ